MRARSLLPLSTIGICVLRGGIFIVALLTLVLRGRCEREKKTLRELEGARKDRAAVMTEDGRSSHATFNGEFFGLTRGRGDQRGKRKRK